MNGDLIEAALHVQAMRLVCKALADREQQGIEVDWCVLRQMHDQMDAMLQGLEHKHRYDSSEIVDLRRDRDHWRQARQDAHEAGELMRAEIETLRKELADAKRAASDEFTERQVLTVEQQQDAAAWQQQVDSANAEVSYLRARLDEEWSVIADLRQRLADAQRAVSDAFAEVNSVRQQLDAANAAVTLQRAGIERLQAFVGMVRAILDREYDGREYEDIANALAELDGEPTPATEPAPEVERLRAFVAGIDNLLEQDRFDRRDIAELLIVLRSNSSVTLTSSPTPVAETLDAEGGA